MRRFLLVAFLCLCAVGVNAQTLTPTGIGDLPAATTLNPTDMTIVCQAPPCRAGTQLNSTSLNRLPLNGIPPITYTPSTMSIGLAIDSTLTVVSGQLHVVGGGVSAPTGPIASANGSVFGNMAIGSNLSVTGSFPNQTLNAITAPPIPNAVLISGNGSTFGSVALGTGLSLAGTFPTQTLNSTGGGGGGAVSSVTGSGQITVAPTTGAVIVGSTGLTNQITIASACTGASCTPVTSCLTFSNGIATTFATGSCSGGGGGGSPISGGGGGMTGGGGSLTGG